MGAAATRPPCDRDAPIPVSLITGFLGSGKTTFLNRLLADPAMAGSIVIINEIGEVGLDHLLVAHPREDLYLLSSGCLCCTVRGDLVTTLRMLHEDRGRADLPWFDRILIETTGLAEPMPILVTVVSDPDMAGWFKLNTVLTTVDAVNGPAQLERHEECRRQLSVADHVLLTKTDLASADEIALAEARIRAINPGAERHPVVLGEAGGRLVSDIGLGAGQSRADAGWLAIHGNVDGEGGHSTVTSFTFTLDEPVSAAGLEIWVNLLETFRGPDLLRVKGLLNVDGQPMVVHAVQHLFHPVERLERWPSDDRRSRIVFITHGIGKADIEKTLAALHVRGIGRSDSLLIDPAAYGAFADLARRFS